MKNEETVMHINEAGKKIKTSGLLIALAPILGMITMLVIQFGVEDPDIELTKNVPLIVLGIQIALSCAIGYFLVNAGVNLSSVTTNEKNIKNINVEKKLPQRAHQSLRMKDLIQNEEFDSKKYPGFIKELSSIKSNYEMSGNSISILISFCKNHTIPSALTKENKDFTQQIVSNKISIKEISALFKEHKENEAFIKILEDFVQSSLS